MIGELQPGPWTLPSIAAVAVMGSVALGCVAVLAVLRWLGRPTPVRDLYLSEDERKLRRRPAISEDGAA